MSATSLAEVPYESPVLVWRGQPVETEPIVWWAVAVGFLYAVAIAYASYCRYTGGDADISFSWHGFKVTCSG